MHLGYLKVIMLFRSQSTKLHFVVPPGTPNDSSVKYVSFWFPDFVSEGVFIILSILRAAKSIFLQPRTSPARNPQANAWPVALRWVQTTRM